MAGDWIKMRANLAGDPAIRAVARAVRDDVFTTIGRLHALWAWADQHTDDGVLRLAVLSDVDEVVQKKGFGSELVEVGWLEVSEEGIVIPNWHRHNGKSAKQRAMEKDKKSRQRRDKCPDDNGTVVPHLSRYERDRCGTREEKSTSTPIVPASGDGTCLDLSRDDELLESTEMQLEVESISPPPEPDLCLQRAKAIFRMRQGTALDASQSRAWRKAREVVRKTAEADWLVIEGYHAAEAPYRRRDLATLLNNWLGEVTRAQEWAAKTGWLPPEPKAAVDAGPPKEVWMAALAELIEREYPGAPLDRWKKWADIDETIREQLTEIISLPPSRSRGASESCGNTDIAEHENKELVGAAAHE